MHESNNPRCTHLRDLRPINNKNKTIQSAPGAIAAYHTETTLSLVIPLPLPLYHYHCHHHCHCHYHCHCHCHATAILQSSYSNFDPASNTSDKYNDSNNHQSKKGLYLIQTTTLPGTHRSCHSTTFMSLTDTHSQCATHSTNNNIVAHLRHRAGSNLGHFWY